MKIFLGCCLLLLMATGCAGIPMLQAPTPTPTPTCWEISQDFIDEIVAIESEWGDATQLAGSTSRIALSPVIASMQEIRRRTEAIESPECSKLVKTFLVDYMDKSIEGFLLFIADEPESKISSKLHEAIQAYDRYKIELSDIAGD